MTTTKTFVNLTDTAKLVRAALKQHFAGVKFAVRTSRYSMGSSIDVSWSFGPTTAQVDAIVGRFAGSTFDGMDDSRNFRSEIVVDTDGTMEEIQYAPDSVSTSRAYVTTAGVDCFAMCCRHLCTRHKVKFAGVNTLIPSEGEDVAYLAHRLLGSTAMPTGYHGIQCVEGIISVLTSPLPALKVPTVIYHPIVRPVPTHADRIADLRRDLRQAELVRDAVPAAGAPSWSAYGKHIASQKSRATTAVNRILRKLYALGWSRPKFWKPPKPAACDARIRKQYSDLSGGWGKNSRRKNEKGIYWVS